MSSTWMCTKTKQFVVLEILRYYPDPQTYVLLQLDSGQYWDLYDVVVASDRHKYKFVLTADEKVRKPILSGCHLVIKKHREVFDELRKETIVVLEEVEVVPASPVSTHDYQNLPWHSRLCRRHTQNVPIASCRLYFVDLWTYNIQTPQGFPLVRHKDLCDLDLAEVFSLREVLTRDLPQTVRPTVLVKVMRKSRLIHYVSPDKRDEWPVQLPLLVADRSGWCSVVIWGRTAVQLHLSLHEGCVLSLRRFRIKDSFQQGMDRFPKPPRDAKLFPLELSLDLDRWSSITDVTIIDRELDTDHSSDLRLPLLESRLLRRVDLMSVPDNSVVDVAGRIMFVGRIERDPKKVSGGNKDSGGFFYRRWLLLEDSSSPLPMPTLVYAGEQIDLFMSLRPGQCILCRHMLTCQKLSSLTGSRQKRHGWLSTTTNSWIYRFEPSDLSNLPKPFNTEARGLFPPVTHKAGGKRWQQDGGFFLYPPFPQSVRDVLRTMSSKLVPSILWGKTFGEMTWGECRQMALMVKLVSVDFVCTHAARPLHMGLRSQDKTAAGHDVSQHTALSASSTGSHSGQNVTSAGSSSSSCSSSSSSSSHQATASAGPSRPEKQEEEFGTLDLQCISQLWPVASSRTQSRMCNAVNVRWQGVPGNNFSIINNNNVVHLNTVKPCAFVADASLDTFSDLLLGNYDSELGLADCAVRRLSRGQVDALRSSATHLLGRDFLLLVDVFTTEDRRQLVVLGKAFPQRSSPS
ncbi:RPA-related protein RADX [Aplysia californica]|uniref:RPA-related protein RADX n=1 Tax=Aplysia californica TaxID=6500 RepID=A0ABM1A612_APLCA|nr:RPA-related protein RADX [Aplysia californica]